MCEVKYDFSQHIKSMSFREYQSSTEDAIEKRSLLELSKITGFSYKDLKTRYDRGLSLLLAIVQSQALFETKKCLQLCPTCGKIVKRGEKCKHEIDYYNQFDDALDNLEYLGFISFEKFVILSTYRPDLLTTLINRGNKKSVGKKIC